jgi:pyridoxal phosphate enzyme (YggS family)
MSKLINNIANLKTEIPSNVEVVLATKYASIDDIGIISNKYEDIIFGENRVQSGDEKQQHYPNIKNPWHFIGHLQRNKVKKVLENYTLIHSVDSLRLIAEINTQSEKKQIISNILLQLNPIEEESKFGFGINELSKIESQLMDYKHLNIQGLMTMAPHTENVNDIKKTFKESRKVYDKMKLNGFNFNFLSMGMSNDYKIAIDEGSNMIRIGSIIFR